MEWIRFHDEELHSWHLSPTIVRVSELEDKRGRVEVRMGDGRSVFKILTDKPIGNRPLGCLGVRQY